MAWIVRSKVPLIPRMASWRGGGGGGGGGPRAALNAGVLQLDQNSAPKRRSRGRRDRHADAETTGFVDDLEQILTGEGVAARKDQLGQRVAEVQDLAKQSRALFERELARVRSG